MLAHNAPGLPEPHLDAQRAQRHGAGVAAGPGPGGHELQRQHARLAAVAAVRAHQLLRLHLCHVSQQVLLAGQGVHAHGHAAGLGDPRGGGGGGGAVVRGARAWRQDGEAREGVKAGELREGGGGGGGIQ